jgi:hypothetical protein
MTLQAFSKRNGDKMIWVAVPLELVDWMAAYFGGQFVVYLASLDPYSSIKVSADRTNSAMEELTHILAALRSNKCDAPEFVDLFGQYGTAGAKQTVTQMMEFFEAVAEHDWKVVSIGD